MAGVRLGLEFQTGGRSECETQVVASFFMDDIGTPSAALLTNAVEDHTRRKIAEGISREDIEMIDFPEAEADFLLSQCGDLYSVEEPDSDEGMGFSTSCSSFDGNVVSLSRSEMHQQGMHFVDGL